MNALRKQRKALNRANDKPVVVLKTPAPVGYLVPAEAEENEDHTVAVRDEVMEGITRRRAINPPAPDYVKVG